MRPGLLVLALCLVVSALAPARAQDAARPPGRADYFIDFRARSSGMIGHTYLIYGRIDSSGRMSDLHHAGFYPRGEYHESPVLAVALVSGYITLKAENPRELPTIIYRRRLTAEQYALVHATVHYLKRSQPLWHLAMNNCNDFAAGVAHSIGLVTPPALMTPYMFVRTMRAINGGAMPY